MTDVNVGDRFQNSWTNVTLEVVALSDDGGEAWARSDFEEGRTVHFTTHTSTLLSPDWSRIAPFFEVGKRYEWGGEPSVDFRYECLRVEEFDGTRYATLKRSSRGETRVMMLNEESFDNFREV